MPNFTDIELPHREDDDIVDTYADTAKAIGISVPTLRRLVDQNKLTSIKVSERRRGVQRRHRREYVASHISEGKAS